MTNLPVPAAARLPDAALDLEVLTARAAGFAGWRVSIGWPAMRCATAIAESRRVRVAIDSAVSCATR